MIVDVLYEGLTLASGANARPSDGDGLFVELESPMPVGTRVTVRTPDGERSGRVDQINEGTGPGIVVRFAAAAKPAAPVEESKNGESDDEEPGDAPEPGDAKKPSGGSRRGKRRKTMMGH